jgi:hypothetical protein
MVLGDFISINFVSTARLHATVVNFPGYYTGFHHNYSGTNNYIRNILSRTVNNPGCSFSNSCADITVR